MEKHKNKRAAWEMPQAALLFIRCKIHTVGMVKIKIPGRPVPKIAESAPSGARQKKAQGRNRPAP